MGKFIDKYWGAWAFLGLLLAIVITGWASGVNHVDHGPDQGFFYSVGVLIGQGNGWAIACVGLSAALVVLTVQGWVRGWKAGNANAALWPALLLLGKLGAALLSLLAAVALGVWLYKRQRAAANDAAGWRIARLSNQ